MGLFMKLYKFCGDPSGIDPFASKIAFKHESRGVLFAIILFINIKFWSDPYMLPSKIYVLFLIHIMVLNETLMKIIDLLDKIEQIRKKSQHTNTSRLTENARAKVEARNEENQAIAKADLIELFATITASQDANQILYFKQLVVGYGLGDLLGFKELGPSSAFHPNSGNWGTHYNQSLYQKILPLCQLAYLEEKNGIPEDHALKLSLIFTDEKAVYEYLKAVAKSHKPAYLVHDACLFDLPTPKECNFEQLKKIANKKSYMANPRFIELLPHMPAIETIAKRQEGQSLNIKTINAKEQEVQSVNQRYSKIEQTPITNPTEADKLRRKTELMQLSQERSRLSIELAELSKGLPLQDASITVLQAFYEAYKANSNTAHKILIEHGISAQNISLFYSLQRNNDDQAIPNLLIKGSDLGYSNYYLTKLDTQNDTGAALAACLGRITNCCQYLGGAGTDCAKYGIESPNSGFYVMFQGDENHPNLNDRIVAQAWVWCDKNSALCLDSIEAVPSASISQVSDFYRDLSMTLCEDHGISRVNTGAQSGITTEVALDDYPTTKMHTKDYSGYNDSTSQLLIADTKMPYIFLGKVDSGSLQLKIARKTHEYFKGLFLSNTDLKSSEALQKVITYLIYSKQDHEHDQPYDMLLDAAGNRAEELIQLIEINRNYINHLNDTNLDLAFALLDQGAYINAMNSSGKSLLHAAVLTANRTLIEKLVERNINLDIQDKNGNTALINAVEERFSIEIRDIARYLVERGASVDIKDKGEYTPLIIAVRNQDLDMVRYLIDRGADLDIYDGYMRTAVFWAAQSGNWEIYSELSNKNCRTDVVSHPYGDNLLMAALKGNNSDIIRHVTQTIPVNLFYQNQQGISVLHLMLNNSEFLSHYIASLPTDQQIKALSVCDVRGQTVLYYAVLYPESLQTILDLVPEVKNSHLLSAINDKGETVLHRATEQPASLKALLELLPEEQRMEALSARSHEGDTVLHYAVKNHESMQIIIDLVPALKNSHLLSAVNNKGETILHRAAEEKQPALLRAVLELFPETQRLEAIGAKTRENYSVLHCAANKAKGDFETLKVIYEFYPENQRPVGIDWNNKAQVSEEISEPILDEMRIDYSNFDYDSYEFGEPNTSDAIAHAATSTAIVTEEVSANDELYEKLISIIDTSDLIEPGVKLKGDLYPNLYELKKALEQKEPFNVIQAIAAKGVEKNNEVKTTRAPELHSFIDKRLDLFIAITQAPNLEQALGSIKEKLPEIYSANQHDLH